MTRLETKNIKHSVFDAYGTLFDLRSATSSHQKELRKKVSLVSDLWRKKQLEYTWLRSLMGNYVDFSHVTKEALDFALDSNGICDDNLKQELLNSYQYLTYFSEIPKFLKSLKNKGLGIYILSNGTFDMLKKTVINSNLDQYFDWIFSVDTIRVFKPNPKVYAYAAKKLECKPQEILFFSSNSWDIAGASSFGFQSVWVNRFNQKSERLPGKPVLEIKNLRDFLKYLDWNFLKFFGFLN